MKAKPLLCFDVPDHYGAFPEAFKIFLKPFNDAYLAKQEYSCERGKLVDEATCALLNRYTVEIYVGNKKKPMDSDSLSEKVLSFFSISDRQGEKNKNRRRTMPAQQKEEQKKKKVKSKSGTQSCEGQASKDPLDLLAHVAMNAIENRENSIDDENTKEISAIKGQDSKSSLTDQGLKDAGVLPHAPQGLKEGDVLPRVSQESPSCDGAAGSLNVARVVSSTSTEAVPNKGPTQYLNNDTSLNDTPNQFDVLLGREKESANHVGNKSYLAMVALNRNEYKSCKTRDAKSKITTRLIHEIHARGGRFLKKNTETGEYEQVHHRHAHEKVSHALRQAKDAVKKGQRKKRKVNNTPPTPQENATFESLYTEQQRVLQKLMAEEDATILGKMRHDLVRRFGDSKMTPVAS